MRPMLGETKGIHTHTSFAAHLQHTLQHTKVPLLEIVHSACSAVAFERGRMSVGTLVGSGRVDPYVLDVASMHASALAFLY